MFLNGRLVGAMEHGKSPVLRIPPCSPAASALQRPGHPKPRPCHQRGSAELLVLVHAMGRSSAGCDWDFKGLVGSRVLFEGAAEPCVLLGGSPVLHDICWHKGHAWNVRRSSVVLGACPKAMCLCAVRLQQKSGH